MVDQSSGTRTGPRQSLPPPETLNSSPPQSTAGYVDFFGPSPLGWVIGGWISAAWDREVNTPGVELHIDGETSSGYASIAFFHRPDVGAAGYGFIMALPNITSTGTALGWVRWAAPRGSFTLIPAPGAKYLADEEILQQARMSFGSNPVTGNQHLIQKLLPQRAGAGAVSSDALLSSVFLTVEETYRAPPNGAVLRGWFFDPTASVRSLHILGNGTSYTLQPDNWIRLPRPDVVKNIASPHGEPGENCGFLAYVPDVLATDGTTHIEVETKDGNRVYQHVPPPHKQGLAAIESLLSGIHLRYDELRDGFNTILGPAITAINTHRLLARPRVRPIHFGPRLDTPRCSIVIPLYGRVDFLEYQLGLAPRSWGNEDEIIYVLDDPRRLSETESLALSCYERFRVPFTVLVLDRNMGYAPANNIGVAQARGRIVCLLNSDIIPKEPRWLDYMIESLASDDSIGVVGALLLFEDGSVQHEGCILTAIPELANWHFPIHINKGFKPELSNDIRDVDMVTGACMVLDRARLLGIGGLDEGYIIGDFEDADLCHNLQKQGLRCVVDRRAVLYHLERQSQDTEKRAWRLNLTLFNAWRHDQRWRLGAEEVKG